MAITATGAWYGAGLKQTQEIKQVLLVFSVESCVFTNSFGKQAATFREATLEERCAQLESRRDSLIAKKVGLEKKINELESRISGKESKGEMGSDKT